MHEAIVGLSFNRLLESEGIALADVRLLRHQDTRVRGAPSVYTLWLDDRAGFEAYQASQSRDQRAKFAGAYWASFVADPAGATFFVGLYQVMGRTERPSGYVNPLTQAPIESPEDFYQLILAEPLRDLIGRLYIDWGAAPLAWVQRADNQDKRIVELRRQFAEPPFPGHLNFLEPLSRVPLLPLAWKEALRNSRGVYLLTCPRTREQYVGSATGEDGFLGRWLDYLRNGHGGNVVLQSREPSDYQVAILEVARSSDGRDDIVELEMRWMHKLQSRALGLNG